MLQQDNSLFFFYNSVLQLLYKLYHALQSDCEKSYRHGSRLTIKYSSLIRECEEEGYFIITAAELHLASCALTYDGGKNDNVTFAPSMQQSSSSSSSLPHCISSVTFVSLLFVFSLTSFKISTCP